MRVDTRQCVRNGFRSFLFGIICLVMLPVMAVPAGAAPGLGGLDLGELLSMLGGTGGSSGSSSASSNADSMSGILELLSSFSKTEIKDCTVAAIADQKYTGKEIRPTVKVTDGKKTLKRGTDYTVTYKNNKSVGTAKAVLTGKGDYTGTKQVSFHIVKSTASSKTGSSKGSSSKAGSSKGSSSKSSASGSDSSKKTDTSSKTGTFTVKLSASSYIYNGKARKPSVTVTVRSKSVPKTGYTVTYKNNTKVGRATVTVKGKGDYKGYSAEKTFKITLKKTTLSGASSPKEGQIKASWTKDTQAEGYQVEYATNKTFTNGKRVKAEGGSKQSVLIENLTGNKQYYVRIRSYKKVGSSNWYSEWSAAKQVRVK